MSDDASDESGDEVSDAIARLRAAGVELWDAPAIAHLERGITDETAIAFATRVAMQLDDAKASARATLGAATASGAIDATRASALATQIEDGDVFEAIVEIDVAVARHAADRPVRAAWIAALRSHAAERHLDVADDDALVGSLLADASLTTRAAKTVLRGRAADEDAGPYHPGALVNALLVELGSLSPSLLAARLALLEDVSRVLSMTGAPMTERASVRPRAKR
jgi:hypothetical protein